MQTLEAALKGKLSQQDYPFVGGGNETNNNGFSASLGGGSAPSQQQQQQQHLPRLVVVFVVGGTTFEEAAAVAEINAAAARGEGPAGATGARVLLGGTGVFNSSAFLRTSWRPWPRASSSSSSTREGCISSEGEEEVIDREREKRLP